MTDPHVLLSLSRIVTAILAGTISIIGSRAYARTQDRSILMLAAGAGLLAAGYFIEGALVELAGWTVAAATTLESITTLLAVAILVASLYRPRSQTQTSTALADPERGGRTGPSQ